MNFLKNSAQPKWIDWFFYTGIVFICWISFLYVDIISTIQFGMNIWESNITNFYQYSIENPGIAKHPTPTYPYLIYIIFGIWNSPIWLITKLTDAPMIVGQTYMYFLWAKLMVVAFVGYSAYLVYKICLEMDIEKNKAKWCVFIYLTSTNLMIPAFVIFQYDIIMSVFTLLGIRAYNKNNNSQFLIWFALAIAIKIFSIFIFIPLILLKEKNIWNISKKILLGCSFLIIQMIFFTLIDPGFKDASSSMGSYVSWFLSRTIPGFAPFSIFLTLYFLICLFCFVKPTPKDSRKWIIYIPMITYAVMFTFMHHVYYWLTILAPFVAIALFQNVKNINFLLICNTVAELGLVLEASNRISWFFDIGNIRSLGLLPKIFHYTVQGQPYTQLVQVLPKVPVIFYSSFWLMGIIAFLIFTYPSNKLIVPSFEEELDRKIVMMRFCVSVGIILLTLFCFFYTGDFIGSQNL